MQLRLRHKSRLYSRKRFNRTSWLSKSRRAWLPQLNLLRRLWVQRMPMLQSSNRKQKRLIQRLMQKKSKLFNNLLTLSKVMSKSKSNLKLWRRNLRIARRRMRRLLMSRLKTYNWSTEFSWTKRELRNTRRT